MEPSSSSLSELIADPERYQGQKVSVTGYCVLGFEGKALYPSQGAHGDAETKKAVWLDVPLGELVRRFDGTTVRVVGTFDATTRGHLGLYAATLKAVELIEPWSA